MGRLKKGWSIEEAFELVPRGEVIEYEVGGKVFNSLNSLCKYYNKENSTVKYRLNKGMTLEQALDLVPVEKEKTVEVRGKFFVSIPEACKYFDVKYVTVLSRMKKGYSLEEAIFSEKRNTPEKVVVGGKEFESFTKACKYYGLERKTVKGRLDRGWTLEEAFGLVGKEDNKSKRTIVDGKEFSSFKDACKYYGLGSTTVNERLKAGWSTEEAFGLVPLCRDGIIDRYNWSKNQDLRNTIILEYLGNNMYKCQEDNNIRYYSKDELFDKFREVNNG